MKVASFNTLATVCADNSPQGFPNVHPGILEWKYRSSLIERKLVKWCVGRYVICLQEVDQDQWYTELFNRLGYTMVIGHRKPHHCVIAYPCEMSVEVLANTNYTNYTQEYMIVKVGDIILCNTHLKAKTPFTADRLNQVTELLSHIPEGKVIVAGDFNESIIHNGTCIHYMMTNGYQNAHPFCENTTCKIRDVLVCHKIDWIWFKKLFMTESSTEMTILTPLPTATHPSDHVAIGASFDE